MSDLVRVRARVRVKVRARVSARIRVRSSVSVSVSVSFTRLVSGASGRARVKYPTRGPRSQTARARNGQTSSYLGRVRATRVRVPTNLARLGLGLGLRGYYKPRPIMRSGTSTTAWSELGLG